LTRDLRRDVLSLGLLALEAASTLLAAWVAFGGDARANFLISNKLPLAQRLTLLGSMFAASAAAAGGAVALRILGRASAERIEQVARRGCPLALLGLAVPLFRGRAFVGHELTFVCLLSVVVLALIPALDLALRTPALFRPRGGTLDAPAPGRGRAWRTAVGACALAYAAYFSYFTVRGHHNFATRGFDLGLEENVLWNIVHGGHFFKTSPMYGPQGGYGGEHMPFLAYLIAPLYALYQHAETLLVLHSILIAAAALPLFALARRRIGERAACVLAICYLLSPAVHGANLYDFHYLTIAPVFVWTAWWALDTRRDRLAALLVPLALCVREDIAADMVIVGLVILWTGERPRAGALVAAVSAVYFVVLRFLVMPRFATEDAFAYLYRDLQPEGMPTVLGVLATLFSNPVFAFEKLLVREKLLYALQLLAPLAFVPLRRSSLAVLLILPGFFITLLTTGYAPTIQITFQYTTHWTLFLFPGVALTLVATGPVLRRACLCAIVFGTLAASSQFGAVLHRERAFGGFAPYPMERTEADRERYASLRRLLQIVPADAAVVASESVVPHLSNRAAAYSLENGPADARFAIYSIDRGLTTEVDMLLKMLQSGDFGLVEYGRYFMLLRRGAPTEGNPRLIELLEGARRGAPPANQAR
jgi:uncharacterized membrane protein